MFSWITRPEDFELIKDYPSQYLGFSYYRTTTYEDGMPILGNSWRCHWKS